MGGAADTAPARPLNAGGAPGKPQAAQAAPSAGGGGAGLRVLKFFAAVALIPACVGLTLGAHDHFFGAWSRINYAALGTGPLLRWFGIGAAVFTAAAVLLWRPVVVYVFGHELVHALATWLCLGKVSNLRASASGGQVTTSKTNTFIRLAPYCVPLYVLLAAGVYAGLDAWWRPLGGHIQWLAFAFGFFYAFHVGFTLWSLRRDQPDLRPDGWFFSLVLIYMANVVVFVLLLGFLLHGQARSSWEAVRDCCTLGWQHSEHIYRNLAANAQSMLDR